MRETRVRSTHVIAILAFVSLAVAFGQFGSISALGDVAKAFGTKVSQSSFTARAGLSGSTLSIGGIIFRAASLLALPLAALGDRFGRRRILRVCAVTGLCVTACAALSPGYWWFVFLFALARPALSASTTLSGVMTAELSTAKSRVTALAIIAGGAGVGAGLSAILHGVLRGANGFRVLFAIAVIPAALVAIFIRRLPETHGAPSEHAAVARLGAIPRHLRSRLGMIMAIVAAVNAITGPANFFAFIYGENILRIHPGVVSTVVALSAITGLAGLLIGRRLADGRGRRRAVAVGVLASAATSLYAYSGGAPAFISGYMIGVCAAAMLAPALAALATESFPGDIRASAGGWIVVAGVLGGIAGLAVFGLVADHTNSLAWASLCAFVPGIPTLLFLRRIPETKGLALD